MRNIDVIRQASDCAKGRWPDVLAMLSIKVPASPRAQVPCPACGGKDRFRFDDDGRGAHFCNVCGAGDGLELVKKVMQCDISSAAQMVADALGIDTNGGVAGGQPLQAISNAKVNDSSSHEEMKKEKAAKFSSRLQKVQKSAVTGESAYLANKGLGDFAMPVLPDGAILVHLRNSDGVTTGAQVISSTGEKRLLTGSVMSGSWFAVNAPETVEVIVIGEGMATSITASLMRPDALSVAAISANNLKPVAIALRVLYPSALIIFAADNDWHAPDELDEKGKPKINTGIEMAEKAAAAVSGFIASPPGNEKADWDDVRQREGLEAATAMFNASLYQLGSNDVDSRHDKADKAETLKAHVECRSNGVYWVEPTTDKQTGEILNRESWLCSPLKAVARGDSDGEEFLILQWIKPGRDATVTRAVRNADIGDREGWRTLKAGGVNITTKNGLRAILADWLQHSSGNEVWSVTPRSGWHMGAYIMPDGTVIGTPEKPIMFSGGSAAAPAYTCAGSTKSWRENVAALAIGNPFMMLGIATALAAPLISLVGTDSFGIHLFASSTAGKTTTADLATSLYGKPERQRLTWYGTALGIANEAEAHNDGLLSLDEIGQGTRGRDVFTSAYTLFNGKGKLQGDRDGGNRTLKHWETVAISTGEVSVETFLTNEGVKVKAGQLVRLLNIPVERATEFHGHQNGKHHADALKAAWADNHGAAGREWILYLSQHREEVKGAYAAAKARWASLIPQSYGEQVHRVSDRFAALEAALIVGRVITGWDEQKCRDALQHVFNAWISVFGTGNKEYEQILEQADSFLSEFGMSRFAPLDYNPDSLPIHRLAGFRDSASYGEPVTFYVLPKPFKEEMASGFDKDVFASALAQCGMLKKGKDNYQKKTPRLKHLGGVQKWTYAIVMLPNNQPD